jgi:hypothetical protein
VMLSPVFSNESSESCAKDKNINSWFPVLRYYLFWQKGEYIRNSSSSDDDDNDPLCRDCICDILTATKPFIGFFYGLVCTGVL